MFLHFIGGGLAHLLGVNISIDIGKTEQSLLTDFLLIVELQSNACISTSVKDQDCKPAYHHLLHHASSLAIEIAQFAIFRHNFRSIDLWVMGQYVGPPRHLVDFFEMDQDDCLIL